MKRGQTGIGLVILGVVAIIAVIGLVLLFTKASSTQGAAIGNIYGSQDGERGIAPTYPTPQYIQTQTGGYPVYPEQAYPAYANYPSIQTMSPRTPVFIVSGKFADGGFATIEDFYSCERDLLLAVGNVPHDLYNAYTVPNKGASPEVTGKYPPASSAYARPTQDYIGKTGGDVYAYMNSVGAEQTMLGATSEDLNRDLILTKLVDGSTGVEKYDWGSTYVNGVRVPVCWVSAKSFPFPQ